MFKFFRYLQELTPQECNRLLASFLASLFGSVGTTAFLLWVTSDLREAVLLDRLILTFIGIFVYGSIVWVTFYIVYPESRPALKRIIIRED